MQNTAAIRSDPVSAPRSDDAPRPAESRGRLPALFYSPGLWAGAIVLLGATLRFYRLDGRSLWLDEVASAYPVRFATFDDLWRYFRIWTDNMPGLFLVTWLLRGLGGSEWAVRLPLAVAGTLNVLALYALGRAVWRPRVGLIAAGLLASGPFAVWYSQEARPYALLMLFTTLQMLCAYRAGTAGRPRDWAALVVVTLLNLYTGYLALAPTAAVYAFIGATLLGDLLRSWRRRPSATRPWRQALRPVAGKIGWTMLAGAVTAAAYLPWLPFLQAFLARTDLGFGQVAHDAPIDLRFWPYLLAPWDLTGPVLLFFAAGLVTSLALALGGRVARAALPLCWLAVPLAGYWLSAGSGMATLPARHYAPLYPAAMLLVAYGVEGAAHVLAWAATRLRRGLSPGRATRIAAALLVLPLAMEMGPALAQSYARPKDDYRGVAARIMATSPPATVVLGLGVGARLLATESLGYYFWLNHSPILVEDGRKLDSVAGRRIAGGQAAVWAITFGALDAAEAQRARATGLEVTPFAGLTLLRAAPGTALAPVDQARALLHWDSAAEPQTLTSVALLDTFAGGTLPGANRLPPPTQAAAPTGQDFTDLISGKTPFGTPALQWALWPGAALAATRDAFRLAAQDQEVNITLTTRQVAPGATYLLSFRARTAGLRGVQSVYVSAHSATGRWLDTFPDGKGYVCAPGPAWTPRAFALTAPPATAALTVWLRVDGTGTAEFDQVALRSVP